MMSTADFDALIKPGQDIELRRPRTFHGTGFTDGVALGQVVLHDPRVVVTNFVAEDTEAEQVRMRAALDQMRLSIDDMLSHGDMVASSDHREILESYRMFAHDRGWVDRLTEAINNGLTAEAAVERVQNDTRARMMRSTDPYIKDRLHDLDDLANRLLSGGIDLWWRRCLVKSVGRTQPSDVLDLATGSGDVAFALSRGLPTSTAIVGMDFCQPMLDEAEIKKAATTGTFANVVFRQGDGLDLPLPDASFDAVTISFGLRNMADRARALREMRRVLRRGGHLFVLEFSQPYRWFRPFYFFYLRHLLPWVAGLVTGDRGAYDYLCGSVETFPTHEALTQELAAAGFSAPRADRLTLGIVALHQARALPVGR